MLAEQGEARLAAKKPFVVATRIRDLLIINQKYLSKSVALSPILIRIAERTRCLERRVQHRPQGTGTTHRLELSGCLAWGLAETAPEGADSLLANVHRCVARFGGAGRGQGRQRERRLP